MITAIDFSSILKLYTPVSTSDSEPVVEKEPKEELSLEQVYLSTICYNFKFCCYNISLHTQFSYSLYIELPLEERRRTLELKIADLQIEIDRLNELISGAESDLPREPASLSDQLTRSELVSQSVT